MNNLLKSVCEHFNLRDMPFLKRSMGAFESKNFSENKLLLSPVFFSRQIAVVSGIAGLGKSSLLFYIVNKLEPSSFRVCHIELSNPNKKALYKTLAVKMGLEPAFIGDDIKLQLINFFNEENGMGKFNCIVIEEAHTLSIPMIDELRSFYDEGSNFSMILSGLPYFLSRTMKLSLNQPMKQRINMVIELEAMSPSQTMEYINHQLDSVNAKVPIFDNKCYPLIHSISFGIPRRINQLCYRTLINGYINKKYIITAEDIQELADKCPHIFDKIILPESGITMTQNAI